jgi:DNA (cytosine-5)-methyltransferase 1
MLVLSLFPGIGLLDRAFEEEGFTVVRGPDLLWGGDIKRFRARPGRFDGIIGGPPCQAFSQLRFIVQHNGYQLAENLIPEFERCVAEAAPSWFVMDVPDAPVPNVRGYRVIDKLVRDCWCPDGKTNRLRRFSFGFMGWVPRVDIEFVALHPQPEHAVLATGGRRPVPVAVGGSGKPKRSKRSALANYGYNSAASVRRMCELQGLPADFLDNAPFTLEGKGRVIGNGVPLPMGRAIARAVKQAIGMQEEASA